MVASLALLVQDLHAVRDIRPDLLYVAPVRFQLRLHVVLESGPEPLLVLRDQTPELTLEASEVQEVVHPDAVPDGLA